MLGDLVSGEGEGVGNRVADPDGAHVSHVECLAQIRRAEICETVLEQDTELILQ